MKNKRPIIVLSIVAVFLVLVFLPPVFIAKSSSPYDVGYAIGKYSAEFLKTGFLIFSLGYFIYQYGIRRKP
ncbi:MAG TPA: hypothetical protein VKA27_03355, partial [Sunxiuqinia sp.]|nr:hypothetical protein [Sunxiuqinia sp.]